jgi:flagellar protein FlbD
MIVFRRLGGELIALNPDLIERIEATPDTVVTLVGENKFLVEESLEEVLGLITDYRAFVMSRSMALDIDIESNQNGGRVLHIVPAEHVASPEVVASGETFNIAPDPDFTAAEDSDLGANDGLDIAPEGQS